LWTDTQVSGYGHGCNGRGGGWRGLRQVVCVRTTHEFLCGNLSPVIEDHHYLTSLPPTKLPGRPDALLVLARRHWEIENGLHHKKDRSMGEDAQRCKRGATVMARLRSLDVGLLPYIPGDSTPLKQIAVQADPAIALRLLRRREFPTRVRCDF
jgi:hypothetical protein